jgi:hypothetical protein
MKPILAEVGLFCLGAVAGALLMVARAAVLARASNSGAGWRSRHVAAAQEMVDRHV